MKLGSLRSGGIIATYRCTAACGHCIQNSSPEREGYYIGADAAADLLAKVRALGCRSLHVGGGEPFIDVDGLCALLGAMRRQRISIEYIETNGFWAADPGKAEKIVRRIAEYGRPTVMLSLCPYHAEYVPLASVRNALAACDAQGLPTFVWQDQFAREVSALGDERKTHSLKEYETMFPGALNRLPERFGVGLLGRAAVTHADLYSVDTDELLARGGPCRGPLRAGHFHVDCFGDYQPPGCPGIAIALADAGDILPAAYPAIHTLAEGGVRALCDAACEKGFVPRDRYANECALCQHVRTFLAAEDKERWPDLRPAGFYQSLPLA